MLFGSSGCKKNENLTLPQMKATTFSLIDQDFDELADSEACYSDTYFLRYVGTVEKAVKEITNELDNQDSLSLADKDLKTTIANVIKNIKFMQRADEYRDGETNLYYTIGALKFYEAAEDLKTKL
jgi:hypothetical protein